MGSRPTTVTVTEPAPTLCALDEDPEGVVRDLRHHPGQASRLLERMIVLAGKLGPAVTRDWRRKGA